jgi:hypothetical protein
MSEVETFNLKDKELANLKVHFAKLAAIEAFTICQLSNFLTATVSCL